MAILKILITKFWPVFIPLILYILWIKFSHKVSKKRKKQKFGDGPIKLVMLLMVLCMVASIYFFVEERRKNSVRFIPNRVEDGKLVPSRVEKLYNGDK